MSFDNMRFVMQRELTSYFSTPVAWVVIVIFLVMASSFTFYLGGFYEREIADLQPFFAFHPWLYLFLVPPVGMRLWAEERESGTVELLLTLPLTAGEAIVGMCVAAWLRVGRALALRFALWTSVNVLGSPDNGVIAAGYSGSWLMAGGMLAISMAMSAVTKNQVVAFILSVVACFAFLLSGMPMVLDLFRGWLPQAALDGVANLCFLVHFDSISRGVIDLRDLVFFALVAGFWLTANRIILELKKAG